tara:strand:+ start:1826 stop:2359 length:534 start_codon:yes stop_codon:yes gene_type:complete
MDSEKLQQAIFGLHTRRFGTVAEIMIKKIMKVNDSDKLSYDLFEDSTNSRIECKFSRVQKKAELKITENNLFKALTSEANRDIMYHEWKDYDWDCNIQQVKKEEFDILFYGIFFKDCILIFKVNAEDIGKEMSYSNKQHRGNTGEGQFHLKPGTLKYHLDYHLFKTLTYGELLEWLK